VLVRVLKRHRRARGVGVSRSLAYTSVPGSVLRIIRRECRTSLSANRGCWHAPPMSVSATLTLAPGCSPWRLRPALGGTRLPSRTVAAGPTCGAQVAADLYGRPARDGATRNGRRSGQSAHAHSHGFPAPGRRLPRHTLAQRMPCNYGVRWSSTELAASSLVIWRTTQKGRLPRYRLASSRQRASR